MEAKWGYWNVVLDKESSYLTTFNSPWHCSFQEDHRGTRPQHARDTYEVWLPPKLILGIMLLKPAVLYLRSDILVLEAAFLLSVLVSCYWNLLFPDVFWFFATESCCFVIVFLHFVILFLHSGILLLELTNCTSVISFWDLAIENCSFVIALFGGCYPPWPNTLLDLQNSSYPTKAEFNNC